MPVMGHRSVQQACRPGAADEVAVLEAIYRVECTEHEWLEGLARALSPLLDDGWGVGASTWNVRSGAIHLRGAAIQGGPEGLAHAALEACRSPAGVNLGIARSGPCTSLSQARVAEVAKGDADSQRLLSLGVCDGLFVLNTDPGGFCAGLMAYRAKRTAVSRRFVSRWSRVASHLGAGFRIRRELHAIGAARPNAFAGAEAIFTPTGRLAHAEPSAQRAYELLAQGVLSMAEARGKLRRHDSDAALDAWKGLVAGRWSLLERIDTDGKCFLVAHRNDPQIFRPLAISLRERQILSARGRGLSVKLIAYELGLSSATVSRALRTAMAKLGIMRDADLAALFAHPPVEAEASANAG
jgi:DNA-binding CsgD family transcriptional regulator